MERALYSDNSVTVLWKDVVAIEDVAGKSIANATILFTLSGGAKVSTNHALYEDVRKKWIEFFRHQLID